MQSNLITNQKHMATKLLIQHNDKSIRDIMRMIPNCILSKQTVHRLRFKLFNKEQNT